MPKLHIKSYKIITIFLSVVVFASIEFLIVLAGNLNPTSAPGDTMYTLEQIYCKMTGCTPTSYGLDSPATPAATMYTLTEVYNASPAFRTSAGNATTDDVCSSKQYYTDTNTMQTGTRDTNYNGTGVNYCCAGLADGQACNHNDQCLSGFCSLDGYCCSTACADACKTCSTGTCANASNSNWGAGLYGCTASDARCYSGTCHDCSNEGGYFYSDNCSGCAGQGGNACWRYGAANTSCNTTCNTSYGGCIAANWNDVAGCPVLIALGADYCWADCSAHANTSSPQGVSGYCWYRSGASQSCSGTGSSWRRACVCQY